MNSDRLPELPAELKPFEADLAALAPTSGLNRDELMYRAGWAACAASGTSGSVVMQTNRRVGAAWLWPLTTAGLVLLSATLGLALVTRPPKVELVYVERPVNRSIGAEKDKQPMAPTLPSSDDRVASSPNPLPRRTPMLDRPPTRFGNDYLSLRERVLAFGVDVLPATSDAPLPDGSPAIGDSRYGALIGQLRGGS